MIMSHIYSLLDCKNCRTHQLQMTQICFFSLGNKRLMGRCIVSQHPRNPNETNREKSSWVQVVNSKIIKRQGCWFLLLELMFDESVVGLPFMETHYVFKGSFLIGNKSQAKITTKIEKSINFQLSLCPLALNPRLLQPHGDGNLS